MVRLKEGAPCCVCPCPCEGLIDIIGKKWVLCVLAQLGNNGTMRFNKLLGTLSRIDHAGRASHGLGRPENRTDAAGNLNKTFPL